MTFEAGLDSLIGRPVKSKRPKLLCMFSALLLPDRVGQAAAAGASILVGKTLSQIVGALCHLEFKANL
jgi:hypothetical protein